MKIALIGRGKTGSAFLAAAEKKHEVSVFTSSRPASLSELKGMDAAVVFVPPTGFADLADLLVKAGIPVVSGTTGVDYSRLSPKAPWIVASNFSLGMNLTFLLTKAFAALGKLTPAKFHIREVHHTDKKDSPSGTAIYLKSLLPGETPIEAERVGDAKGLHTLEARLGGEILRLEHEALSREVFGQGALFAVESFLPGLGAGVHRFEQLMEQKLRKEIYG